MLLRTNSQIRFIQDRLITGYLRVCIHVYLFELGRLANDVRCDCILPGHLINLFCFQQWMVDGHNGPSMGVARPFVVEKGLRSDLDSVPVLGQDSVEGTALVHQMRSHLVTLYYVQVCRLVETILANCF